MCFLDPIYMYVFWCCKLWSSADLNAPQRDWISPFWAPGLFTFTFTAACECHLHTFVCNFTWHTSTRGEFSFPQMLHSFAKAFLEQTYTKYIKGMASRAAREREKKKNETEKNPLKRIKAGITNCCKIALYWHKYLQMLWFDWKVAIEGV